MSPINLILLWTAHPRSFSRTHMWKSPNSPAGKRLRWSCTVIPSGQITIIWVKFDSKNVSKITMKDHLKNCSRWTELIFHRSTPYGSLTRKWKITADIVEALLGGVYAPCSLRHFSPFSLNWTEPTRTYLLGINWDSFVTVWKSYIAFLSWHTLTLKV